MKTKFDILTIGGAVQDITFFTSDGVVLENPLKDPTRLKLLAFEYGAKMKIDEANFSFGGGAQNAAVGFARLGFKVAAMVSVGDDGIGENIVQNLKINKVNTNFVQKIKNAGTGFSFVLTDKKTSEHVIFSYRGASSELAVSESVLKKISPRWIYLTSLSGGWENNVMHGIFGYKNKSQTMLAWNPGVRQLAAGFEKLKKYLRAADVLILNKDEATELAISAGRCAERKGVEILAKELYGAIYDYEKIPLSPPLRKGEQQFGIVVITDGKNGAYAYDGEKIYYAPIIDVKRVDTTGVGDAFGSSFVAGLELYKGNIQKSLELGILNTSSVVGKVGAENGLLYRKDIIYA